MDGEYVGRVDLFEEDGASIGAMEANFHAAQERRGGSLGLWRWWGTLWLPEGEPDIVVFPGRALVCRLDNGREGRLFVDLIDTVSGLGTRNNPAPVKGNGMPPFV